MREVAIIRSGGTGWIERLKRAALGPRGGPLDMRYHALTNRLSALLYASALSEMPKAIEVETISRCNGGCGFCPVNRHVDPRPAREMSMDLVERIADELNAVDYAGHLALFSNNEPLLDKRIAEICRHFRRRVPRAWIYLYTNGTPLTFELYVELARAGLDELIVNNYSDDLALRKQVRRVLDLLSASDDPSLEHLRANTQVYVRPESEVLSARAGSAPNKQDGQDHRYFERASCGVPYMQMVIRPTGEVSLCCQDALGQVTLGDVSRQSIREVWNGSSYRTLRQRLEREGRGALGLCRSCDAYFLYVPVLKRMLFGARSSRV